MATNNRRVAAYLPPEIDEAFTAFKIQRGLSTEDEPNQNDSQGLIQILSEFLEVSRESGYSVSYPVNAVTQDQLDSLRSELVSQIGELSSELSKAFKKIESLETHLKGDGLLTVKELAERLKIDPSTLSHWKGSGSRSKAPDQLLKATRDKDPDGIGWILVESVNKFKPERSLSGDSPSVSQFNLLNS